MKKERRTQEGRSALTRAKLIAATLDVVYDLGYHRTTTQEIARRARVSRGALLHHFPTKADLVCAAMEALLNEGTDEIRAMARRARNGEITQDGFVDFLWEMFSGRFFYLSLEHITEARNNAELRHKMIPVVRSFHEALDEIWTEFCRGADLAPPQARVILNMTVCLLRGMGVQTVLRPDRGYYEDLLKVWKRILADLIQDRQGRQALTALANGQRA